MFAFLVGAFGMFGVCTYALEPQTNPSRYQLTVVPILAFVVGLPATVLGIFDLWRNRSTVVGASRLLYFTCLVMPALSIVGLAITDWAQNGG